MNLNARLTKLEKATGRDEAPGELGGLSIVERGKRLLALLAVARERRARGEAPSSDALADLDDGQRATLARIVAHMGGEAVDHA